PPRRSRVRPRTARRPSRRSSFLCRGPSRPSRTPFTHHSAQGYDSLLRRRRPRRRRPPIYREYLMPSVRVRESEHFDAALRRFKRACEKAGILTELRRREYYEKPTQERKRKKAAAIKRHMKRNARTMARRRRLY